MRLKDWYNLLCLVGFLLVVLFIFGSLIFQLFTALGVWDVRFLGLTTSFVYCYLTLLKGIWELGTNKTK